MDGIVGSNSPCVAVTLLASPRTAGDVEPCVATLGDPVGREKLCKDVALAVDENWL